MNLFIFGSTGDLAKRKIFPALNEMNLKNLNIFAMGRRDFIDSVFLDFACKENCIIKDKIHYLRTSFEDGAICNECEKYLIKGETNYFYVSLPPSLFKIVFEQLKKIKDLGFEIKVLVEKPFGNSLNEAKELNLELTKFNLREDVFLNDHYLFKNEILNLEKKEFKQLKIVILEKLGLEGRITYYDSSGALIDMIQSHLLNILFKFLSKEEINNLKIISYNRLQYDTYEKELGKKSDTETFAKVLLKTGNKKIELITGKKLFEKETFVLIDNKRIDILEGKPYIKIFENFLINENKNFLTVESALIAWEIIEKIKQKKGKLKKYASEINFNELEK